MLEYYHVINYINSFNSYNACQNCIKFSFEIPLSSSNILICTENPQVSQYLKFISIEISFLSKCYRKKFEILTLSLNQNKYLTLIESLFYSPSSLRS